MQLENVEDVFDITSTLEVKMFDEQEESSKERSRSSLYSENGGAKGSKFAQ